MDYKEEDEDKKSEYDENLRWILYQLIDPTLAQKKNKEPKIETDRFVTFIHRFFYD